MTPRSTPRSTLPLTPLASIPLSPSEFENVWLVFLAAGAGAGRLFTEDEIRELLGREITERLRATTKLFKAAAAAAKGKGELI